MKAKFVVPLLLAVVLVAGCTATQTTSSGTNTENTQPLAQPVPGETVQETVVTKEIYMESFTVIKDGKYYPQFSPKEITVNQGDRVVLYINTTSGMHDFKLDEFNVYSETPTGKVTKIEFTADKAGEFIFYCNQPNHRANGHWGTLKVV